MNPSPRKKAKAQLAPASLAACRLWRRSSRIGVAYSGKANVFAKAAITNTLEAMFQAQRRERHHTNSMCRSVRVNPDLLMRLSPTKVKP